MTVRPSSESPSRDTAVPMRVLKRAHCTLDLGGSDSGWRPAGSAPYAMQTQSLTLEIHHCDDGFFLYSFPSDGALAQAESQFGAVPSAWTEVST